MIHCQFLGSVFRGKTPKPHPEIYAIEDPLLSSGMLGSDPAKNQLSIVHRSLPSPSPAPIITAPKSRRSIQRLITPICASSVNQANQSSIAMSKNNKPLQETFSTSDHFKKRILTTMKPKEAPNAYFAKFLPPTAPASSIAFLQMNEMLDKMVERLGEGRKYDDEFSSFNHIFGEIVRQYFIECGSQGEVLENCRHCFTDAKNTIPKITMHYRKLLQAIYDKINAFLKKNSETRPEIASNKEHSNHLLKIISEMRSDLDRLIRHNDELVKSITVVTNESIQMKSGIEQLDKRIASKNQKLLELNEQLQNLSVVAAQYTSDSINFAESLKAIRDQQSQTHSRVDEANSQLRQMMQKVSRIDAEISVLSAEIDRARVVNAKVEIGSQIDLISRRLFREKKEVVHRNKDQARMSRMMSTVNLFDKIKSQFLAALGKSPNDELVVTTYEEFAKLKRVLFNNETSFHIQPEEIQDAQEGNFLLNDPQSNMDYIHLFASKIAMDAVDTAIRGNPLKEVSSQTLSQQVVYREDIRDLTNLRAKSRFVSLIPTDYSMRSCQPFQWLVSTIRTLYHEKELLNQQSFEQGLSFEDFPKSIFDYAQGKYPLDFLRDQFCWDVQLSSHELKNMSIEVDMFVDFLDEKYNEEQLAFFLLCRKDIMKVGCSVQVRSSDQLETFNEFFLSVDQLEQLLPKWWQHRYQRRFYIKLLDFSVPRPAVHLEATKRYVAMHDILMQCVFDYADDTIDRLHEILLGCRIVPRMKMPEFTKLMKSLIPDLTPKQALDFYRATVSKGVQRKEVKVAQFIDLFFQSSILMTICRTNDASHGDKDMIDQVNIEYRRNSPQFLKILEYFRQQSKLQPDNLTLKTYVDDANRFHSMLVHSLTSSDGRSCCMNYYQFVFAVDILFSAVGLLGFAEEEPSLISLECSVRENWLDTVFGQQV